MQLLNDAKLASLLTTTSNHTVHCEHRVVMGKSENKTNVTLHEWMHFLVQNYPFCDENYPKFKQKRA